MPANTPRGYTYPLYTDPANFPAQIQDFTQDVDLDVAAQVAATTDALNRASCRISASAIQNIAGGGGPFPATFTTEDYDNAAMANLGVNNDRIVFTQTGFYLIHGFANFTPNGHATVGGRTLLLDFNLGAAFNVQSSQPGNQLTDTQISVTYMYRVTVVNDYIRMGIFQSSGAALDVTHRSMSVTKVGV